MSESRHILVVDDDREIREVVGRVLEKEGFRVTRAADGAEIRKRLETGAIDLIVLDVMLPGSMCRPGWPRLRLRRCAGAEEGLSTGSEPPP